MIMSYLSSRRQKNPKSNFLHEVTTNTGVPKDHCLVPYTSRFISLLFRKFFNFNLSINADDTTFYLPLSSIRMNFITPIEEDLEVI